MAEPLTLFGFCDSVYTRAVRIALIELNLDASHVEVDPFADPPDAALASVTPFDHVPVLRHGEFVLTETAAILRYLTAISGRPTLLPDGAQAEARMAQVMGIMDAYGYRPMVRDVYSHGAYRPARGLAHDPDRVSVGLADSANVLEVLDHIASEALVLNSAEITLADIHLAPMVAAFAQVPQGAALLARYPAVSRWWEAWRTRASLLETRPRDQG